MTFNCQLLIPLMLAAWLASGCSDDSSNEALKSHEEASLVMLAQPAQCPFACALLVAKMIEDPTERSKAMASIAVTRAEAGQREQALELLSEAREVARIKPWPDLRLWCAIADKYAEAGQQEQASRILGETLMTARTIKRTYDGIKQNGLWVVPDIAILYAKIGEFDQALETTDGIKEPARDRIRAWIGIAGEYAKAGQKDEAARLLSQAHEAAKMFEEKEWISKKSKPFTDIAGVYTQIGQKDQATLLLSQALKKAMTIPYSGDQSEALAEIAINHARNGEFHQALEALNAIEALDPHERCMVLAEIAGEYAKVGQNEQAMRLLSEALKTAETIEGSWSLYHTIRPLVKMGGIYAQIGENEQAAIVLSQALEVAGEHRAFTTFPEIVDTYRNLGQQDLAAQLLSNALTQAMTMGRGDNRSQALVHIAGGYAQAGQKEQALQQLPQALEEAKTYEDEDLKSDVLQELAISYAKVGDFDQSLGIVKAIKPHAYGSSSALTLIATTYAELGQQEQAMKLLAEALQSAMKVSNPGDKSSALAQIASVLDEYGDKEQAMELLAESQQIAMTIGDGPLGQSWILQDVAGKYAEVEDFDQALKTAMMIKDADHKSRAIANIASKYAEAGDFAKALKTAAIIDDARSKSRALADIAGKYFEITEVEKASQLLLEALEAATTLTDARSKSMAFVRIAEKHFELGQKDQANKLLSQALNSARSVEDVYWKTDAIIEIANRYAEVGQKQQALKLLSEAIETAKTIEEGLGESFNLLFISQAYAEAGDFIQALEIAGTIEDSDCKSWALHDLACMIAKLDENDHAIWIIK